MPAVGCGSLARDGARLAQAWLGTPGDDVPVRWGSATAQPVARQAAEYEGQ